MELELIIQALRQRCPVFANRVAGAAEYKILPDATALSVPCAYVIPLDDNPEASGSKNGVRQTVTESFAVVVAVSNRADEKGQASVRSVETLKRLLWKALLGWRPTEEHDGIVYQGSQIMHLDRARLWYQFEFGADMQIGPEDGWQQTELAGLPHFDGLTITVDAIDPADPNVQNPGPDGRIEIVAKVPPEGTLP